MSSMFPKKLQFQVITDVPPLGEGNLSDDGLAFKGSTKSVVT
jgi:hypothetical protein